MPSLGIIGCVSASSLVTFRPHIIFDGTDGNIAVGDVSELSFEGQTDAFTLSGWVKVDPSHSASVTFMGKQESSGNFRGWSFRLRGSSVLTFEIVNTAINGIVVDGTGANIADDSWHHVAVTVDGSGDASGVLMYVDGVLYGSTPVLDSLSATTVNTVGMAIGMRRVGGDLPMDGSLSQMAVHNSVLTPAQILAEFNGVPTVDLVGHWELGGPNDVYPTIPDHSPSGNDGTMTNMAADDIVKSPS